MIKSTRMIAVQQLESEPSKIIQSWFEQHAPGTEEPEKGDELRRLFGLVLELGIAIMGPDQFLDNQDPLQHILATQFSTRWQPEQHGWSSTATLTDIRERYHALNDQVLSATEQDITATLISTLGEQKPGELRRISALHTQVV